MIVSTHNLVYDCFDFEAQPLDFVRWNLLDI
jgi:hypothetical protein